MNQAAQQPGTRPAGPTAIILAGGLGMRLRAVHPDCPKPMAPVLGRPFLEYLVRYLRAQGVVDVVLSTAYRGEQIEAHFGRGERHGMRLCCIREPELLGTGGAIRHILSWRPMGDHFLVLNGDSMTPFDLGTLVRGLEGGADGVILGVAVPSASRFGTLDVDDAGMLAGFREKASTATTALVNAGVYLLRPGLFPPPPPLRASLESDFFPRWIREGRRFAVVAGQGPFIDIGTPESLAQAGTFLQEFGERF